MKRAFVLIALTLSFRGSFADCVPAPAGLAGWWPGDGDANALFAGSAGTLQNGATFATGMVGQAFTFDGQDDFVSTTLDVQPAALPYCTWEAWVYPTRLNFGTRQQILSTDDGSYDRSVLIEGGTSNFAVFTGSGAWQPTTATLNEWQHIAVVFSPTNILFYRNGVQFSLGQAPSGGGTIFPLHIGRNPGFGEFFQGSIDEVSIYRRALTAEEITAIYVAGVAGKCKTTSATSADLSVTVTPPAPPLVVGTPFTYAVLLQNNGTGPATGINLEVQLPAFDASLASVSFPSGNVQTIGLKVQAFLDSLAPGASAPLSLTFNADKAGFITNHFSGTANEFDPNTGNNDVLVTDRITSGPITPQDGDWTLEKVTLLNTPEAALMVRVGDIDNLGFGWPTGFSPFSGGNSPVHGFPWAVDPADPPGTDRIMVPSSYNGHPPGSSDGYTGSTTRPDNLPQAIRLEYSLGALNVSSAALQIFVDDFQASVFGAHYQVKLNRVDAPFMADVINRLVQTGPIGKLLTFTIPAQFLDLVRSGVLELSIDDPTTGAADGYAIDFVKLLVNPGSFADVSTVQGHVTDSTDGTPIVGAEILVNGAVLGQSGAEGNFKITTVAGLGIVEAQKLGYAKASKSADLISGATTVLDFALARELRLAITQKDAQTATLSWPGWASTAQLEFTASLSVRQWSAVQQSASLLNGIYQLDFPMNGREGYFRLKQ